MATYVVVDMSGLSEDRICDILVHAADAVAFGHSELDVAFVAPVRAPRVAHNIVALIALVAIADGDDCMIDSRGAVILFSDDATLVHLERKVAC